MRVEIVCMIYYLYSICLYDRAGDRSCSFIIDIRYIQDNEYFFPFFFSYSTCLPHVIDKKRNGKKNRPCI